MTREKAIEFGNMWLQINEDCKDSSTYAFFQMAIKALEQEPCDKYINEIDHLRKYISKLETQIVEQESSGDLISRQAVLDACEQSINILEAVDRIMDLPSAEQEPKTGHWIKSNIPNEKYVCSECGGACWYYDYQANVVKSRFCPNCGARMVEPHESEE